MAAQFLIQAIESDLSVSNVPSKRGIAKGPSLKEFPSNETTATSL